MCGQQERAGGVTASCAGSRNGQERAMQTVADMIHAFNELFLDFAPAAALIGLAVSWFFRNRRCRETERELRERIDFYRKQETGEERDGGSEGVLEKNP